jgi:uncharacterized membrane protein YhaH (DUF805 family)
LSTSAPPPPPPSEGPKGFWTGKPTHEAPPPLAGPAPDRLTLVQVYTSSNGRIGRQSFWLAGLLALVVELVAIGLLSIPKVPLLTLPVLLIAVFINVIVLIKRWHDRGRSGWMALVYLIPLAGPIWTFVECGCLEGTRGPNQFGPGTNPTPFG